MPQRTNDFQKLILLVRKHLSEGASVNESRMLENRKTKEMREVDVVIEGEFAGLKVLISVECRDSQRKADVTWVETMIGKHQNLPTQVLVLASKKGFTKAAEVLAKESNVETVSYEEQETKDFSDIFGPDGQLRLKSSTVTIEKCIVTVSACIGSERAAITTSPENLIFLESGEELCQIRKLAQRLIESASMRDYLNAEARTDHKWFQCDYDLTNPAHELKPPIFLQMIRPQTILRRIEHIYVEGTCKVQIAEFGMRYGKVSNTDVAWGTAQLNEKKIYAVATKGASGKKKLSIHGIAEALGKAAAANNPTGDPLESPKETGS